MTTTTATLSEFLLARVEEDEAAAQSKHDTTDCDLNLLEFFGDCSCGYPARVLAECEAKRAVVGRYVDTTYLEPHPSNAYDLALFHVMCDLAAIYADHADYDESWRP